MYNFDGLERFFNLYQVKKELGVPQSIRWNHCDTAVHMAMVKDKASNQAKNIKFLLEKGIPVLIYSGDQDVVCNWLGGNEWTYHLKWSGQNKFQNQKPEKWMVNGKYVG